ncbi:hypothetical protein T492DRAFT_27479 [Pavlovales sp. CCMP2436]|nr:hypothetical protein T492DRAFT_27479 [Pavlovales sp. CCMP2436]
MWYRTIAEKLSSLQADYRYGKHYEEALDIAEAMKRVLFAPTYICTTRFCSSERKVGGGDRSRRPRRLGSPAQDDERLPVHGRAGRADRLARARIEAVGIRPAGQLSPLGENRGEQALARHDRTAPRAARRQRYAHGGRLLQRSHASASSCVTSCTALCSTSSGRTRRTPNSPFA